MFEFGVFGLVLFVLWVLFGFVWFCFVVFGVVWCCLVFGIVWCCLVLFGVVWCCLVLFGVVWCFLVLFGVVRCVWFCHSPSRGVCVHKAESCIPCTVHESTAIQLM